MNITSRPSGKAPKKEQRPKDHQVSCEQENDCCSSDDDVTLPDFNNQPDSTSRSITVIVSPVCLICYEPISIHEIFCPQCQYIDNARLNLGGKK